MAAPFVNHDMSPISRYPGRLDPSDSGQLAIEAVDNWFSSEVLPLEPALMRLLRRHWRYPDDHADLRQDIYMRVYEASMRDGVPESTVAFVFTCARNLLVDRARRAQAIPFDVCADMEELPEPPESDFTPEQFASARQELRLLQLALDDLPPRCREVVVLRKIEGLSQNDIADRLGIAVGTVEKQITRGIRALAETLYAQGVEAASVWLQRQRRGRDDQ
jgi:RNA polymerase sigma factor (sigma-70 family)